MPTDLLIIILTTVMINNFVITKFLGLCPFFGVSNKISSAIGLGIATTFVLTLSASSSYIFNLYVLKPFNIEYLQSLNSILIIALMVQISEALIKQMNPLLYRVIGVFLPLITSNCIILAVALLVLRSFDSLVEATLYGFGAGLGFLLMLVLFSACRDRLSYAPIPKAFQGVSIGFITISIAAIGFQGLSGIIIK